MYTHSLDCEIVQHYCADRANAFYGILLDIYIYIYICIVSFSYDWSQAAAFCLSGN